MPIIIASICLDEGTNRPPNKDESCLSAHAKRRRYNSGRIWGHVLYTCSFSLMVRKDHPLLSNRYYLSVSTLHPAWTARNLMLHHHAKNAAHGKFIENGLERNRAAHNIAFIGNVAVAVDQWLTKTQTTSSRSFTGGSRAPIWIFIDDSVSLFGLNFTRAYCIFANG